MKISISTLNDLPAAAKEFVEAMGGRRHFAFDAPMGAGKTTFISAICKELGMEDEASSPTFSIINEYRAAAHSHTPFDGVFHFDFYRIEDPEQALDLGLDDYFFSEAPCFMEWAENIGSLLPDDTVTVEIEVNPDGSRIVTLSD